MPLILPDRCLRSRNDCDPLSQIESDDKGSFLCCGRNDGKTRTIEQDTFRVCWKNESIDELGDWDSRDIIDTISILSQALSVDANQKSESISKK